MTAAPSASLILLLLLFVGFIWYLASPLILGALSPLRKVPGPFAARFSRLWYLYKTSTGQFHHINIDLHKRYGPVVRIAPGQYSIDDPAAIKQIYGIGKHFSKAAWYEASSSVGAPWRDLFTDRNESRHAAHRRLVANLYSTTTLRGMEPEVEQCIRQYTQKLEQLAQTGEAIDLQFWMQSYAFDVISQITLGQSFGFLDSGTDKNGIFASLHEYLRYCALVGIEHELHKFLFSLMSLLPARGLVHVGKFTAESIASKRAEFNVTSPAASIKKQDFLSKLFRLQDENPTKFPDSAVFTTCVTNIGAGSDTTAISLCAVIHNLATHPRVLEKLREEVDNKFKDLHDPEFLPFNETQNMPYLSACIKESLRMHPATGLPMARIVPKGGITISEMFFPAGSTIGVNTWVAHRNTDIFGADADVFKPERWLECDKSILSMMEASWIPFGAGSRTCIGKNISLLEINKLIPVLIKNFNFTQVEPDKLKDENFWLVKQVNMLYKVSKRSNGEM